MLGIKVDSDAGDEDADEGEDDGGDGSGHFAELVHDAFMVVYPGVGCHRAKVLVRAVGGS